MKSIHYIYISLFLIIVIGCKTDKNPTTPLKKEETSILEKIANAHGFQNWKKVNQIEFTFNVARDTSHYTRNWIWKPKTNDITYNSTSDTISYNRETMDSIAYKTNAGFINDRYWLLAPFNLIWDSTNFEYIHTKKQIAPIANKAMNKLTIVYKNKGGYTPGDAYDFYFKDDYLITEWVFRKANQEEASLATTWENYVDHNGFKFAMEHKKQDGSFNLYFNNIQTILN